MEDSKTANETVVPEEHPPCTSSRLPTMYAWEGTGVWVLRLTDENVAAYNTLPSTDSLDEHLQNLKDFGATWYANARDHAGAAKILDAAETRNGAA